NVGLLIQTPPNWIVVDPPSIRFSFQPGGALPGGQSFNVTLPAVRSYSVTPRVVSPTGGNWLGVSATSGVGPGTVGTFITEGARRLPPGSYMAVIDIVGGTGFVLPSLIQSFGDSLTANSGVVCGGGLSAERLVVFLDVGTAPITIAPTLPRDA